MRQTKYHSVNPVLIDSGSSGTVVVNVGSGSVNANLYGLSGQGVSIPVPVTPEGHLEVALHAPRLPFGAIQTEALTPTFQFDGVYGINNSIGRITSSSSGLGYAANNMLSCSTGTSVGAFAVIQGRRRIKYRPGQGSVLRFTALFPQSASLSYLIAGMGHSEDGFFIGYNGTSFGILHSSYGIRQIETLNVTAASSTNETMYLQLGGVTYPVTVTNSGVKAKTAYEIANGTYAGWQAMQLSESVVFLANSAASYSTALFSSSASTFSGSFVHTRQGSGSTDVWVAQSDWNGDKLDGTGGSRFVIDPKKGNLFQIELQYLGFGSITFKTETTSANSNNPDWTTIHTFKYPNTLTKPLVSNPNFPFTMAAYSAGSATNLSVAVGSVAAFVEGHRRFTGPRFTYQAQADTSVTNTAYKALMTIRNNLVYASRANQAIVNLLSWAGSAKDTTPVGFYLIRNATLAGTPVFTNYSSTSCTSTDTQATTCTFTDNNQVIASVSIGQTGDFQFSFEDEVTIQPGETITLAAKAAAGTSPNVLMSLNTREDQ